MDIRIRQAAESDIEAIRDVHESAFPETESPSVATLAANLLSEHTNPETITLVAEVKNAVVGNISFSPVTLGSQRAQLGYILAPLGVKPDFQNNGVGSTLIENGIERVSLKGAEVALVYGDPNYYGKFGFSVDSATQYLPPYELTYPFGWQARILQTDVSGHEGVKVSCVASLRDRKLW